MAVVYSDGRYYEDDAYVSALSNVFLPTPPRTISRWSPPPPPSRFGKDYRYERLLGWTREEYRAERKARKKAEDKARRISRKALKKHRRRWAEQQRRRNGSR